MWGYAEGNRTVIAIVVIAIVIAALAFLAHRLFRRRP